MHDLGFRFKRAHLKAVELGRKKLRKWALSPARFDVLYVVQQGGVDGVLQSRIWDTLGLHKSTISKMCSRLEELGFIRRVTAAHRGYSLKEGMRGASGFRGTASARGVERAERAAHVEPVDRVDHRNPGRDFDAEDRRRDAEEDFEFARKQGNNEVLVQFTLEGIRTFEKAMRLVFDARGWRFAYRVLLENVAPAGESVDTFIARTRRTLERIGRALCDNSTLLYPLDSRPTDRMFVKVKDRLARILRVRKEQQEAAALREERSAKGHEASKAKSDAEYAAWVAKAYAAAEPDPADDAEKPADGDAAKKGDGAKPDGAAARKGDGAKPDGAELDATKSAGTKPDPDDDSYDH